MVTQVSVRTLGSNKARIQFELELDHLEGMVGMQYTQRRAERLVVYEATRVGWHDLKTGHSFCLVYVLTQCTCASDWNSVTWKK